MSGGFIDTREVVVEESRPFLEPGEVVAHVVKALEGPPRWVAMLLGLVIGIGLSIILLLPLLGVPIFAVVYTGSYKRRILLATDQSLVILAGGRFRFTPKSLLSRLDLETKIGPLQGMFLRTEVDGRRLYVVARSAVEVHAADADIEEE